MGSKSQVVYPYIFDRTFSYVKNQIIINLFKKQEKPT